MRAECAGPMEMGGAYWEAGAGESFCWIIVVCAMYFFFGSAGGARFAFARAAWRACIMRCCVWALGVLLVLCCCVHRRLLALSRPTRWTTWGLPIYRQSLKPAPRHVSISPAAPQRVSL